MKKLEDLIALRDQINEEINEILESNDEYATSVMEPTVIGSPLDGLMEDFMNREYTAHRQPSVSININIDNSIRTSSDRQTDIDTNLAGGDSALGLLGGLLEKLFI